MTKFLAGIPLVVAAALLSGAATAAPRDLWIGVISHESVYAPPGTPPVDSRSTLEPVAALVDGKWWLHSFLDDSWNAMLATVGKVPAQWLPVGTALPTTWQGHLFDGRHIRLRTSGPLHPRQYENDELVVATDFARIELETGDRGFAPISVAVAGDATVRMFADVPETGRGELVRFLTSGMMDAERAEVQRHVNESTGVDGAVSGELSVKQLTQLLTLPFRLEMAKTARQGGDPVYFIDGSKALAIGNNAVAALNTGAAASRDRAGALHLIGSWSYLNDGEFGLGTVPLAVLERGGASCWLIGQIVEGGMDYGLVNPGQVDPQTHTFSCAIK